MCNPYNPIGIVCRNVLYMETLCVETSSIYVLKLPKRVETTEKVQQPQENFELANFQLFCHYQFYLKWKHKADAI